jgi:hypothetical protein
MYEYVTFNFYIQWCYGRQSFQMAGAGWGDTNYGVALAEKRLA